MSNGNKSYRELCKIQMILWHLIALSKLINSSRLTREWLRVREAPICATCHRSLLPWLAFTNNIQSGLALPPGKEEFQKAWSDRWKPWEEIFSLLSRHILRVRGTSIISMRTSFQLYKRWLKTIRILIHLQEIHRPWCSSQHCLRKKGNTSPISWTNCWLVFASRLWIWSRTTSSPSQSLEKASWNSSTTWSSIAPLHWSS